MYSIQERFCILLGERGVSAKKFHQVLDFFDGIDDLISGFCSNETVAKIIGENYQSLCDDIKQNAVEEIIKEMMRNDVVAVTCFSDDFPDNLTYIDDKPYVLFCKGNTSLLNSDCMAVIGTRKVSNYGKRIAKDFTAVLSECFTIVSGLAYGVDSIAHESALDNDGKTIAVLGSGVLNIYPTTNNNLAKRIIEKDGLIISEYGLHDQPYAYHFPHRNRIVSGLSRGVLVCQAPAKSGTNSTVELALEQGKDIFVVPGEIYDVGFVGSNRLIKSMQASCVTTPRDIIEYYNFDSTAQQKESYQLSIEEQKVVNALGSGPLTFDQLVVTTGISLADLNFLLANLELKSIIAKLPGNTYRLYGDIE